MQEIVLFFLIQLLIN